MLRYFQKFKLMKPHTFFLVAAIIAHVCYLLVTPPFCSPDEANHFMRTWQVSQGEFSAIQHDSRVGGFVPQSIRLLEVPFFPATFIPEHKVSGTDWHSVFDLAPEIQRLEFRDFPNTANYSPVSYLPQAIAVFITSRCGCSIGTVYYSGRLAIVLVWILVMYHVIKRMPAFKWLITLLLLLPMHLYITSSYNADSVTNILSFTAIALILQSTVGHVPVTRKRLLLLLAVALGLSVAKIIYAALFLLLLTIPAIAFGSGKRKYAFVALLFVMCLITAAAWSSHVFKLYLPYTAYNPQFREHTTLAALSDYHLQKAHLLAHPLHVFTLLYNAVFHDPSVYLGSFVGQFGTYMDLPLPRGIWVFACVFILVVAFMAKRSAFTRAQKFWVLITAVAIYALLIISHHLTWNPVGSAVIDSVQGRYLIPIIPLLLMLAAVNRQETSRLTSIIVPLFVGVFNIYCIYLLYNRYLNADYTASMVTFVSGGKAVKAPDQTGLLKHSGVVYKEDKSGKTELASIGFAAENDAVTIRLWKRGQGDVVVKGDVTPCTAAYGRVQFTDPNGWQLIDMYKKFTCQCDSVTIYFESNNGAPVQIGDHFVELRRISR
jgi:uncharacterized membrane protein